MKGKHIGTLSLYTATTYGVVANKVWSLSGDQGKDWQRAKVSVTSISDFQVIIEGRVGTSYRGDIAVDDVVFDKACNFNGKVLPG